MDQNTTNNNGNTSNGGYINRNDSFGDPYNQNKLPADSSAMTLGIIGLVAGVLSCCTIITGVVGIILSAIGLSRANKSLALYRQSPDAYNYATYKNVNNAKTVSIIGVVISSIATLFWIVYISIVGMAFFSLFTSQGFKDALENNQNTYEEEYNESEYNDTTEEEMYQYEEEVDTLQNDSLPPAETP